MSEPFEPTPATGNCGKYGALPGTILEKREKKACLSVVWLLLLSHELHEQKPDMTAQGARPEGLDV
jgi:hypothetical protein